MDIQMTKQKRSYCTKQCPLGIKQAQKFLQENDSISDAAIDMEMFIETCENSNCPYERLLPKTDKN